MLAAATEIGRIVADQHYGEAGRRFVDDEIHRYMTRCDLAVVDDGDWNRRHRDPARVLPTDGAN